VESLVLGLALLALALMVQLAMLLGLKRQMVTRQQAYVFHSIRDQLQLHVVEGRVRQDSEAYEFLLWACNLAMRNAGTMRLSDLVKVTAQIERRVGEAMGTLEDIQKQPEEVQRLAAECFSSLAKMLIANDTLVRAAFALRKLVMQTAGTSSSVLIKADQFATSLFGTSTRARAVASANRYLNWSQDLLHA